MQISVLYRYDGISSSVCCTKFKVLSETPCGYWVQEQWVGDKKWVSKTGKKRLCYSTKKEALHSLICRREIYLKILRARIDSSQDIIYECKKLQLKEK